VLIEQQSLPSVLMQRMRFCGDWFKIYHVQNFVQFFSGAPCITPLGL